MKYPFFAPECLQLSSIDCGVAALSTLLAGYGSRVSYERLRELCQTGVDGTSIDSLEDISRHFGVEVIQHVVPSDLVLAVMHGRYPLIAIFTRGRGIPHFVTIWRSVGRYLQVMDPQGGRRWMHEQELESCLFGHTLELNAEDWSLWMNNNSYRESLFARARALLPGGIVEGLVTDVLEELQFADVAALDAALRLTHQTQRAATSKHAASGRQARWNEKLFRRAFEDFRHHPKRARSFTALTQSASAISTSGTVLLAVPEAWDNGARSVAHTPVLAPPSEVNPAEPSPTTIDEGPERPGLSQQLAPLLSAHARRLISVLFGGIAFLSLASTAEILVYRAAVDAPALFTTLDSRSGAAGIVALLVLSLFALEAAVSYAGASLGRHLELKLRLETLYALPRVQDHFVRSRPTTDLAYRAHNLVTGSQLPLTLLSTVRALGDLLVTLAAIAWLGLQYLPPLLLASTLLVLTFLLTRSRLRELDTRNQVHNSRLLTLFLDALRGSRPIRLHGYQDSFRREQQRELELWRATGDAVVRTSAGLESANGLVGAALVISVFVTFALIGDDPRRFVLLAFWAFRIPPLIRTLVTFAQDYPLQSISLTRLLEVTRYVSTAQDNPASVQPPLRDTSSDSGHTHPARSPSAAHWTGRDLRPRGESAAGGVGVSLRDVRVVVNEYAVLDGVSLEISQGEHLAIVGHSGSGKSSLAGLLLGFHWPTSGEVLVDGERFDLSRQRQLMSETVWVDPGVQLWNSSIRDNVNYATRGLPQRPFLETAELSDLLDVIDHVDRGLDTGVGAGGTLISGGEGQRLRLARGLRRSRVKLVVLDEAFRGLDRPTRERLTQRVRSAFPHATLLSISHDIRTALEFPRVVVMGGGRIVEEGVPAKLAEQNGRFKRLLDAEARALDDLWSERAWRRLWVGEGVVRDETLAS